MKKFILFCIFIMFPAWAHAQNVRELTLDQAIEIAHQQSNAWTQFDAKQASATAQYKEVQAHWWPILSVTSSLMFWSDPSVLKIVDKNKLQQDVKASLQNLDLSATLSQIDPAMQLLLGSLMPVAQQAGAQVVDAVSKPLLDALPQEMKLTSQLTFTLGASLKMPLTPLFKVYQAQKLAQIGIDNVDAERRAKALAVTFEVTDVYLKLVYAQRMHQVANEALDTIHKHVEMARKYEHVGMLSHSDVLSAEVEELKAKQKVVEARNGARLASLKLAQTLNLESGVEVKAIDSPSTHYQPELAPLHEYQQQALQARNELERLELGIQAAQTKKKIALLDYVPQIALMGTIQYANGIELLDPNYRGAIGLMMNWNIFDGLEKYYAAQKASFEAAELESKSNEAKALIELEVSSKYLALETALDRVELTQQALTLAQENLRTISAQFAQGESVNTEVLTAQTQYSAAQADDIKARIDILAAFAALKLSLGQNPALETQALIP